MGHLKQTNIDINKYKNDNIRQVCSSTIMKGEDDDNKQKNGIWKYQSGLSDIPADKIVLLIVIAILLIVIVFMVHGIINR